MKTSRSISLLWDASALAKRYAPETGSETADALFDATTRPRRVSTMIGCAETYSLLLRKLHSQRIDETAWSTAANALETDIFAADGFDLLPIDDAALLAAFPLMRRHALNATDAAILYVFLRFARSQAQPASTCVLVAADQRLLRAAEAEGLRVFNPEHAAPADVNPFLAML